MYRLLRTSDSLSEIEINPHLPVFCDTETMEDEGYSSGGLYGKIRLFQLYQEDWDMAIIIDCMYVPLENVLDLVHPHRLVFHNAAFDVHTINRKTKNVWIPDGGIEDTLYLSRLAYWTKTKFGFYDCLEYARLNDDTINNIDKKEEQKSDWSGPLSNRQLIYAACDVIYLCPLFNLLQEFTQDIVYRVDIDSLYLAVEYTRTGMPVNQETVKTLQLKYMSELENVLELLPINPRSYTKAAKYLGTKDTKSETLIEEIRSGNERAQFIKTARHCYKSLEYLNSYDRPVIRGFFQPCTSLSGRFSCTGGNVYEYANLQQMPEELHSVVEAPEGYHIIYKDYSGLELRMAAAFTGEPTMCHLMKTGADMHLETAKYLFSKDDISDEERTVAKTFNFSAIYGGGVHTIRNVLWYDAGVNMPFNEVKELRNKWFDMYKGFSSWHKIFKRQMNIYGYIDVDTALGRQVRAYKLTDALNIPIQGSSAEVTKMSLLILKRKYPDANIINTIHDSNILLHPANEAEFWGNALSESMVESWKYVIEDLADPDIPMPGGFEHGPIWTFH